MKILIELPSWLGDSVMCSPAIENLISHFTNVDIILVGSFASTEVFKNHPNVIKTYKMNKKYRSFNVFSKELGKFDYFFSFRSSLRSKVFKFFIKSKNKFQYSKYKYQNEHQVEKYNRFVNDCLGENFCALKLKVYKKNKPLSNSLTKVVGISPGASYGDAKRWYPLEFAKLALSLSTTHEIIIFGGDQEKDIAYDIENFLIKKGVTNYQNLSGKTSITELIELISGLDLFITGDSGPMHIAASFAIPTVAIFGPTSENETSQWKNKNSIIVKKSLDCQPCLKRICPLKHHNCMKLSLIHISEPTRPY